MENNKNKQAFLLLSNKSGPWVKELYNAIKTATEALGHTVLLYHNCNGEVPELIQETDHHAFDDSILESLQYNAIGPDLLPGNNHFPVLEFYLQNQQYDYYWYIEDDVRLYGDWRNFFQFFSGLPRRADFISSHIRRYFEEPLWHWWNTLSCAATGIPHAFCVRSFNPIFRISRKALQTIHEAHINKWQGHHEVLIPTLLHLNGFDIMDFGGKGTFVPAGFENRFYLDSHNNRYGNLKSGTMRFRPVIKNMNRGNNILYHPVKWD